MMIKIGTADTLDADEMLRIAAPDPEAGLGALGTERGNLPLESIDVRSAVVGLTVRTEFALGFRNPYEAALEATYIFPLPDRAAVTGLRMEADGRVIEGVLQERAQARAEYDQAIAEGKRASIAEEERPGVFSMRVGQILPGELVVIRTTLSGRLPFEDGEATYRFPLVVAPRYIPGSALPGEQVGDGTAADTDAVPDASRISPPLLLPGFPNPVRLSVEVDVDPAGLPLISVKSSLHGVEIAAPEGAAAEETDGDSGRRVIRLLPGNRVDRDFILRLRYGSEDAVTTSLAVRLDEGAADATDAADTADGQERAGTFVLTVLPPSGDAASVRRRDVVLVLDRSGSMDGWKMVAARRAAGRIVDTLTSADRFAVLGFDNVVETAPLLPEGLAEATDRHRFRAIEHLARMEARGGTEMAEPLRQAADLLATAPDQAEARDRILVLVTDGQVGNEDQILESLAPHLGGIRVHTIGIDRAVNAAFLERLARVGGGRCELVESEDRLDEAMVRIHRRIGTPLVTGLSLAPAGLAIDLVSVEPSRLPDLFAGAPLVVSGRFRGEPAGAVLVRGSAADGTAWQTSVTATVSADAGLAAYWARGRVRDLEDSFASGNGDAATESRIVEVSLKFGVLCRFTSFVAIDSRVVNQGGAMKRVTQPVDSPSGWDMLGGQADGMGLPAAAGGVPFTAAMAKKRQRSAGPFGAGSPAPAALGSLPLPSARPSRVPAPGAAPAPSPSLPAPMLGPAPDFAVPEFLREAPAELRVQSQSPDLAARISALLDRLRANVAAADAERVAQLAEIATELRLIVLDGDGRAARPEQLETLRTLADELERPLPAADRAELDRRWQHAVTVLAAIVEAPEPPRRAAFWKRRS